MICKNDLPMLMIVLAVATIFGCSRPSPVQQQQVVYTLVYEIDPDDPAAAKVSSIEAFREPAERRLRSEYDSWGEIRTTKDKRLQVGLYDKAPETVQSVKQRFLSRGNLELRILANFVDHADWIDRAKSSPGDIVYDDRPDREGKPRAKWVRVIPNEAKFYADTERFATRMTTTGETELLVMLDPYNISSASMKRVVLGFDTSERPCVDFQLNPLGAELFGRMTGANLPDADGHRRQLGIILDGDLYSAPIIQSVIYERGQITGNFTDEETNELAIILGAGPFPALLRLVNEGAVDPAAKAEK